MDPRERNVDQAEVFQMAMDGRQAEMWTALPAIVVSFDPAKRTVSVQSALKMQMRDESGTVSWVSMPLMTDCPVFFAGAGGWVLTFPIKQGDEGLLLFGSRCIDAWWQNGGVQQQLEFRMHDLSDGFFLPGIKSVPNVEPSISTTAAQLRSADGHTYVEVGDQEITCTPDNGTTQVRINPGEVSMTPDSGATRIIVEPGSISIVASTGTITLQGQTQTVVID